MDDLMSTEACTLPTADRPTRLAEFDDLFAESAREVSRDGAGVRILLAGTAGLRERVLDLTRRETECCSFFTFVLERQDDDLILDVTVPAERRDILDALADRAQEHCA
jgi:hypothetical protein